MKIQLASDLHCELLPPSLANERIIQPAPDADLLVLAGDIHVGLGAVDLFKDWPVPVLYLAGNHEFYGQDWTRTRCDLRQACFGTQIHFLDNDSIVLGGVRFLGCTLWTDFQMRGFTQTQAMSAAEARLNDYFKIKTPLGSLLATQTLEC